jgi:hypothetical protein
MGRACSTHEDQRKAYRILVGKPEGNRRQGTPRCRWEDNIKMDLREKGMIYIGLIWLSYCGEVL